MPSKVAIMDSCRLSQFERVEILIHVINLDSKDNGLVPEDRF